MIKKLRRPTGDLEDAIRQLYDKLNEVIDRMQSDVPYGRAYDKSEQLRVEEKPDGSYSVQFKTSKGWIESDSSSATGFKLKEE